MTTDPRKAQGEAQRELLRRRIVLSSEISAIEAKICRIEQSLRSRRQTIYRLNLQLDRVSGEDGAAQANASRES